MATIYHPCMATKVYDSTPITQLKSHATDGIKVLCNSKLKRLTTETRAIDLSNIEADIECKACIHILETVK